jgi:high-affinity nickel permease
VLDANALPLLALAGTSLALGARHGLDWDHIAVITDLTSPREGDQSAPAAHTSRGLTLTLAYCLGHALVLVLLAAAVLSLGLALPTGLDGFYRYAVGLTLVLLGVVVLVQLTRHRGAYQYAGRISLVAGAVRRGWARARRRPAPTGGLEDVDRRGAFVVGLLHGTGAATPTQLVLFATAAAAGSLGLAAVVLGAFVVGLTLADLGIAGVWVSGLVGARRSPRFQLSLGGLTAVASLGLGLLILGGQGDLLPALGDG